jgi:hypothetical protein
MTTKHLPDPLHDRKPWDAQPGETSTAYHWFCRYRELPAGDRSLPRVISDAIDRGASTRPRSATTGHRERGEAPSMNSLKRWASKHHWEARAVAYDQDVERRKFAVLEDEAVEAARRHALQLRLASNVLAWPLQRFWERAMSRDPEVREQLVQEFEGMSGPQLLQLGAQISRALPAMQDAERAALGISAGIAPDAAPVDDEAVTDYVATADRLSAVMAALEEAGFQPAGHGQPG